MYDRGESKRFRIRMAGLVCEITHHYDYIRSRCADYIIDGDEPADLHMSVPQEYFDDVYAAWSESPCGTEDSPTPVEERIEFASMPLSVYGKLPDYDAVWLHAVVVEYRGKAYAFTARSGYGKTTHARLWLEAFGPEARIINGDNPILRIRDGQFHAFGTPFSGKEGYQVNTGVPLAGICYLTHSQTNSIRRMEPAVAMMQLFYDNKWRYGEIDAFLDIYGKLVEQVPVYQLYCNMDVEAAHVAWQGMQGDQA